MLMHLQEDCKSLYSKTTNNLNSALFFSSLAMRYFQIKKGTRFIKVENNFN